MRDNIDNFLSGLSLDELRLALSLLLDRLGDAGATTGLVAASPHDIRVCAKEMTAQVKPNKACARDVERAAVYIQRQHLLDLLRGKPNSPSSDRPLASLRWEGSVVSVALEATAPQVGVADDQLPEQLFEEESPEEGSAFHDADGVSVVGYVRALRYRDRNKA